MRELNFSAKEFELLQQAENNSNQLVELEVNAMNIIDNPAHSEQQQLEAISLLNGEKHHQEKARVMQPINEFFLALEQRTKTQYEAAMASVAWFVMLTTLVVCLGILGCIIGYIIVKTKITTPISTISQELLNINKSKDLTSRLSDKSQSEIGAIAGNFNELLQLFQSSYKAINTATNQVAIVTDVVASLARDSSQQATSQMEELEMAAVAIEQMTTALASVSESTQNAEIQAAKSEDHVDSGLRLFSVAVNEMQSLSTNLAHNSSLIQALSDESKNVGNVLDVIKSIAEQTNLLALNAAIEAARAGEQGRGFAVVADEVRTLAQRTSQSTKEIEQMIANLQQKSEQTRIAINDSNSLMLSTQDKVQQASDSLSEIGNASAEIHNLNTSIAAATEEQLAVSSEISSNITRVKDLSLNMKTAITGLPTKLHELSNSMTQLVKISSEFKV
ncbi:methyl-accepting chemotaxis protein [Rheinheimera sp. D18]|uniref:methyl-accepting chemotaxis protein n=1 Tax=Rheinheimera sp. D18 TaxID=2545632 RepID=UPI001044AFBB|nr:methyl-accepting chemotaxis protein [Rheinheimera sp. D18]QBL09746.1 methyl-accepting chemotaxis protein [Rheinheimera sp. D18]